MRGLERFLVAFFGALSLSTHAESATVLMFVPQQDVYYSEYVVMRRSLEAAGYSVDVRSSALGAAETYMVPAGSGIVESANSLPGGSYAAFGSQFQQAFGASWPESANSIPPEGIPIMGRVQDVANMSGYVALVAIGGQGALAYRVDGSYAPLGVAGATDVESAALSLNELALDALAHGKPVLAQCHAASLPVYWRIPGTSGAAAEALGYSLLKGNLATGFPEAATVLSLAALDVQYRPDDVVTVTSPHASFYAGAVAPRAGDYRIVTTRDWYPQTIAHAARTLVNILTTFPSAATLGGATSVLVLHGGPVNLADCGSGNKVSNDIPCNFGVGANTPADYLDLIGLLANGAAQDGLALQPTAVDLTAASGALPFDTSNAASVANYLDAFDVVVFFKHWSTGVTPALQQALVQFVDDGGGIVGLHHGLYNDVTGALNKDILASTLFGVQSAAGDWSGSSLQVQNLMLTQLGHFITNYAQAAPPPPLSPPPAWPLGALANGANASGSVLQRIPIYDEIYNNWSVMPGQQFGRALNQIEPLLSNDGWPQTQVHLAGLTRRIDIAADGSVGRVVFLMSGERKESFAPQHPYARIVRNAVRWAADSAAATSPPPSEPPGPAAIAGMTIEGVTNELAPQYAYPGLFDGISDGSNGTRWTALPGLPRTVIIDLEARYAVSSVALYPYQSRPYQYSVALSESPYSNYTTVVDRSANQTGAAMLIDDFAPTAGRYVRIEFQGVHGAFTNYVTLNEISVYGVSLPAAAPPTPDPAIAGLSIVNVSSQLAPQFADPGLFDGVSDGSNGTRWTAQPGMPQTLTLDLGGRYRVSGTDVHPYQLRPYRYRVLVADSAVGPFELVVDRSANTQGGSVLADAIVARPARYVRLEVLGVAGDIASYVTINELVVRGVSD